METWNKDNLPENHQFLENQTLVGVTEGTWNRKRGDGTSETAPKWEYLTAADDNGNSMKIAVFSATDKENIKLNEPLDLVVKKSIGKDGTFYGYTMVAFAPSGQPIAKKEPQSRWQKGQKLNAKAEALKAASTLFTGKGEDAADSVLLVADLFEAWLDGKYKVETENGSPSAPAKSKK